MNTSATSLSNSKIGTGYLLFSFSGRISRDSFWSAFVLQVIGAAIFLFILEVTSSGIMERVAADAPTDSDAASIFLIAIPLVYSHLAVGAKRCHDRGRSGWCIIISFIPILGWIWWFIDLGLSHGDPLNNKYGPPPLSVKGVDGRESRGDENHNTLEARLHEIKKLFESGAITEEEAQAMRKKILGI